jgi:ubiquinone/menaquinone biosynthesis C-methylase UbiE
VTRLSESADADYLLDDLQSAESWHFWFQARSRLVRWMIGTRFRAARSVLDIGCGSGFVLSELRRESPHLELAGCDVLRPALARARTRLDDASIFLGDATHLPLRRQFDVVLALDVIEHLDDDRAALSEMFRVTNPGGGVLVTVPQHQWLWSAVDEFSRHRRRYSRADLVGKMRAAGFVMLRCTSLFSATLPLMALSRLWRPRGAFDPTRELRISRAMNIAAEALIAPEWLLARSGFSMPLGSTLVVMARRPPS